MLPSQIIADVGAALGSPEKLFVQKGVEDGITGRRVETPQSLHLLLRQMEPWNLAKLATDDLGPIHVVVSNALIAGTSPIPWQCPSAAMRMPTVEPDAPRSTDALPNFLLDGKIPAGHLSRHTRPLAPVGTIGAPPWILDGSFVPSVLTAPRMIPGIYPLGKPEPQRRCRPFAGLGPSRQRVREKPQAGRRILVGHPNLRDRHRKARARYQDDEDESGICNATERASINDRLRRHRPFPLVAVAAGRIRDRHGSG